MSIPNPPSGVSKGAKDLWNGVLKQWALEPHEMQLLNEAVRSQDTIDRLTAIVKRDGEIIEGKIHPAMVEARLQRIVLTRIIATLGLKPDGRRTGRAAARGGYKLHSVGE